MFYYLMCGVIMHITSCYFSTGNIILLFHLKLCGYFNIWLCNCYFQSKTWSVLHIYDCVWVNFVVIPAKNFFKFMFWDELSEVSDEESRAGRCGVRGVRGGATVSRHRRTRRTQGGRGQHARTQRQGGLDIITMIIRSKLLVKFELRKKPHSHWAVKRSAFYEFLRQFIVQKFILIVLWNTEFLTAPYFRHS